MLKKEMKALGRGVNEFYLYSSSYNRHGLIAGYHSKDRFLIAKVIAELISDAGVSVFITDSSGEMSGLCESGILNNDINQWLKMFNIEEFKFTHYPTCFWDIIGKVGHPIRTTVSEIGPLLMSCLLNLTETQSSAMHQIFKFADEQGLLLLDIKDLIAVLGYFNDNIDKLPSEYKMISKNVIKAIYHKISLNEQQGLAEFFGEPALQIQDLIDNSINNQGIINILCTNQLLKTPNLYSTIMLWLLAESTEKFPTIGLNHEPRMVFIIDNADLLFNTLDKQLAQRLAQILKLLSLKGIGVFFIVEDPLDIPECILERLNSKFISYYPDYFYNENKRLKLFISLFNKDINITKNINSLSYGEVIAVSLTNSGRNTIIDKIALYPPRSSLQAANYHSISNIINNSTLHRIYDMPIDSESAYERLKKIYKASTKQKTIIKDTPRAKSTTRTTDTIIEKALKSAATSLGRQFGSTVARGLLEMLKGDNNKEIDNINE